MGCDPSATLFPAGALFIGAIERKHLRAQCPQASAFFDRVGGACSSGCHSKATSVNLMMVASA